MEPRHTSTTSSLSRSASRRSVTKRSIAQKPIAPTTTMLSIAMRTERTETISIPTTPSYAGGRHLSVSATAQLCMNNHPDLEGVRGWPAQRTGDRLYSSASAATLGSPLGRWHETLDRKCRRNPAGEFSRPRERPRCDAIPHGSARTDCYLGLSQFYRAQSDLAAARARVQSDAARYRAITGTDPPKPRPHRQQ